MDSDKMPEPVAWRCNWCKSGKLAWVQYHDETDTLPEEWDCRPNEILALYSEAAVRELQAECNEQARLNGMGAEREARLMASVIELQAERDALAKDAARYRWLCDGGIYRVGFDSIGNVSLDMLDATIDAAMAEGE